MGDVAQGDLEAEDEALIFLNSSMSSVRYSCREARVEALMRETVRSSSILFIKLFPFHSDRAALQVQQRLHLLLPQAQ